MIETDEADKNDPKDRKHLIRILVFLGIVVLIGWLLPVVLGVAGGLFTAILSILAVAFFGLFGLSLASFGVGVLLLVTIITGPTRILGPILMLPLSLPTYLFLGLGFIGLSILLSVGGTRVMRILIDLFKKLWYYLKWEIMKRRAA